MEPIFTIGHGGRSVFEVVSLLRELQIQFLVDVRSVPYSRHQPDFSREQLQQALAGSEIRYLFMGDALGGRPEAPECYVNGHVSYDRLRSSDFFRQGLERIIRGATNGHRLCLLCSERRPENCHRSRLIGEALSQSDVLVRHIDADDAAREQKDVLEARGGGQAPLFEDRPTSHRRYRSRTLPR
jgi:uncharacterized protein (DUF488 family)